MKNLVKVTVVSVGLAVAMISCSDDQEVVRLPQEKEVQLPSKTEVIPEEKSNPETAPTDVDENLPLSDEFLPLEPSQDFENREASERGYQEGARKSYPTVSSNNKHVKESVVEEDFEEQRNPVTTKASNMKKAPDMGIMRKTTPSLLNK